MLALALALAGAPPAAAGGIRPADDGPAGSAGPACHDDGTGQASLPPGFGEVAVADGWQQAVGVAFDAAGRAFVWERRGVVWIVEDGERLPEPFVDLSEEVGDWGAHGLSGFALDPDFLRSGLVYLAYAVDRHHLDHFGTPAYDPAASELGTNTIARVTRYAASPAGGLTVVDPASRVVLVGDTLADGIPVCSNAHGAGALAFLADGSLAVSTGDAELDGVDATSCVDDGVLAPKEALGAHRAQLVDSLSGKVLRIDPATGDGLADNPFFDPAEPRAPRSRVWALGLRNPYRMALRPGSGAAGGPGALYVGDVGAAGQEELDVVDAGGRNLGWPLWEGMERDLALAAVGNPDAPNPLAGGACPPLLAFGDLVVEDSLLPPAWPNPCDPAQPIVGAPTFVHARPALAWAHDVGPALVPTWDEDGAADAAEVGAPGSPVTGASFSGSCAIAGAWYDGASFPPEYAGTFLQADYGERWIRRLEFDEEHRLLHVEPFAEDVGQVVALAVDPATGDLWYVDHDHPQGRDVRRIYHDPGDLPPTAVAAVAPTWGPAPLAVALDGTASSDPEGLPLAHAWTFPDGTLPLVDATGTHVLLTADVTDQGTIVSKLDELDPPVPMGVGSLDPEVIRDGVLPPEGSALAELQYDTVHLDLELLAPDKGPEDWLGYVFPAPLELRGLTYQEGLRWTAPLNPLGGWWDALGVQARDPATGAWEDVSGLAVDPPYVPYGAPGGEVSYGTYHLSFDPVVADGVRLSGAPGGTLAFVSCGELRVLAASPLPPEPVAVEVVLTVTDAFGQADCEAVTVALNDTPPSVAILSPVDGASVAAGETVPYVAAIDDLEHGAAELVCTWETILHHDGHVHPEPPDPSCASEHTFLGHAMDPGDVLFWEVRLRVEDPLGLATERSVHLALANDCNFNGVDDAVDLATGASSDADGDGVPDECAGDCDGDGVGDLFELVLGAAGQPGGAADCAGDGLPDPCQLAAERPRLGEPPNPPALVGDGDGPVVGAVWTPAVDHDAFVPEAVLDVLAIASGPANVPSPLGTVLCDLAAPPLLASTAPGTPFAVALPDACALVGKEPTAQAASVDAAGGVALTSALDLVVGAAPAAGGAPSGG